MAVPESWRRTGRKASPDHWVGLEVDTLVEFPVYDDSGNRQGCVIAVLLARDPMADPNEEGQTWQSRLLAIQDEFFEWWAGETYQGLKAPLHFCQRRGDQCRVRTAYRDALHVDVFRVLPEMTFERVGWLNAGQRGAISQVLKSVPGDKGGAAPVAVPAVVAGSGEVTGVGVQAGAEGIAGLAKALGEDNKTPPATEKPRQLERKTERKKRKQEDGEDDDLMKELRDRTPPAMGPSALRMRGERRKKKKKKHKKKRSKESGSQQSSSSTSSDSDSLFRVAALPQGVEKLHRLHEEKPGWLADMTLRKFQELLQRTLGKGTASESSASHLPPVCRGYLTQILFNKYPESVVGLRNARELRTLAHLIDRISENDGLRALDIALQRFKSIEMFLEQGSWEQGNLLELIPSEGDARAVFRSELKASQQEMTAEQRLRQRTWAPRRRWENWEQEPPPANEGQQDGENKDEKPPVNRLSKGGKKGKGKGKGRKGKYKW